MPQSPEFRTEWPDLHSTENKHEYGINGGEQRLLSKDSRFHSSILPQARRKYLLTCFIRSAAIRLPWPPLALCRFAYRYDLLPGLGKRRPGPATTASPTRPIGIVARHAAYKNPGALGAVLFALYRRPPQGLPGTSPGPPHDLWRPFRDITGVHEGLSGDCFGTC